MVLSHDHRNRFVLIPSGIVLRTDRERECETREGRTGSRGRDTIRQRADGKYMYVYTRRFVGASIECLFKSFGAGHAPRNSHLAVIPFNEFANPKLVSTRSHSGIESSMTRRPQVISMTCHEGCHTMRDPRVSAESWRDPDNEVHRGAIRQ